MQCLQRFYVHVKYLILYFLQTEPASTDIWKRPVDLLLIFYFLSAGTVDLFRGLVRIVQGLVPHMLTYLIPFMYICMHVCNVVCMLMHMVKMFTY